jgi:uncharacterized membrane protein YraQ (UPF0718 family)
MDAPPATAQRAARMLPLLQRNASFLVLLSITLAAGVAVWRRDGTERLIEELAPALDLFVLIGPALGAGILIAACLKQLVPPGALARHLGERSGVRGLSLAMLAGILTPGGPATAFPMVLVLAQAGADRGALVAFLLAWALNGFQRVLVWELPLLGPDFAALRFASGVALPLLAGLIARRLPIAWTPPAEPPR